MVPMLQGCFKDVINYTDYRIAAYEQTESNGEFLRSTDLETYAFYVDTTQWTVKSYEDALARRITNKTTGETQTEPDAIGEFYADEEYQVTIRLEAETSMLVCVNPTLKLYAYRKYQLPINLPTVDTKLYMASWRPSHPMSGWRVVNDFYTPSTEQEPSTPPADEEQEPSTPPADGGDGDEPTPPTENEGDGEDGDNNNNDDNGDENNGDDGDGEDNNDEQTPPADEDDNTENRR